MTGVAGTAGTAGNLCLGGIGFSSTSGSFTLVINPAQIPQPSGVAAASAGQTWYFQNWFRDSSSGSATANLTNAVALPFY